MESYHDILKRYHKLFTFAKEDSKSVLSAACNIVPFLHFILRMSV